LLQRFSRSEVKVKVICVEMCECYNDMCFDSVALLLCVDVRQVDRLRGGDVYGVTLLNEKLYVLRVREMDRTWFDVYHIEDSAWLLERVFTVVGQDLRDVTSCAKQQCLYVCDYGAKAVLKLGLDGTKVCSWPVDEAPVGISIVPDTCNLLVTSDESNQLFKLDCKSGQPLPVIKLPEEVPSPRHAIQLDTGELLVSHGQHGSHRVCKISSGGDTVKDSYGDKVEPEMDKLGLPCEIAVDKDGFVFVTDCWNDRIVLLSPSLEFVREIKDFGACPRRLCLDHFHRLKLRLYVGLEDYLRVIEL